MQVKVCPKCGAENRPDKASCSGCYTSLEGVAETEAQPRPAPTQPQAQPRPPAQPQAQMPPAAQPLGASPLSGPAGPAGPTGPTPADNYAAPPGAPSPYGPTPTYSERRSAPASRGPNWGAIVGVLILLLGGGGFAGWWFFLRAPGPEAVVQKMIDAQKAGDRETFKSCFSASSISLLSMAPGGADAVMDAMMKQTPNEKPGKIISTTYEDNGATAIVTVASNQTNELVLIKDNGQWKLDLMASGMRKMKKAGMSMPMAMPRH
jgi:hypothetical protein